MCKKDRFSEAYRYLKFLGIIRTQSDVAKALGSTQANVSTALKGDSRVLTDSFLIRFARAYNQISTDWLLYGEGQMLTGSNAKEESTLPADDAMAEILKPKEERVESSFDNSSLVKALLLEKDKRIEGLESQLKDKDIIIQGLREKIMMMEKLNVER